MRIIDADRLKEVLERNFGHTGGADVLRQLIDIQPTVVNKPQGEWISVSSSEKPNKWISDSDAISRKTISAFLSGLISDETERKKALQYVSELPSVNPQPCEDAISRQALIDAIANENGLEGLENSNVFERHYMNIAKTLPSVYPKAKTGHWEKTTDDYCYWYRCSCCRTKAPKNEWGSDYFSPYCPECNAKMLEIPTD